MQTMADLGVTARDRAAAGRHAHRPGQARAARRRDPRAQDPRRPRRRPRPDRPARAPRPARRRRPPGGWSWPRPRAPSRPTAPAERWATASRPARPVGAVVTLRDEQPVARAARRHRRRVARRGRRPGLPRPAARPPAPRGGPARDGHPRRAERPRPASILGVGGYRPARVVTNAEICEPIDSSDEWIRERSGIVERRCAAPDETVVDMAVAAAEKALAAAGITADRLDAVVVATVTHPYQTPVGRHRDRRPARRAPAAAFDISAACAGFCYGLGLANDIVRAGSARARPGRSASRGSPTSIDPTTAAPPFIFGDGAGAVVVGPRDDPGIGPAVWGADGAQEDAITRRSPGSSTATSPARAVPRRSSMEGQQVFRWAVCEMAEGRSRRSTPRASPSDDLAAFIPHQANMRIIDAMVRAARACPSTSSSPATSSRPATRRRRPSRWPWTACSSRGEVAQRRARPARSASAPGSRTPPRWSTSPRPRAAPAPGARPARQLPVQHRHPPAPTRSSTVPRRSSPASPRS